MQNKFQFQFRRTIYIVIGLLLSILFLGLGPESKPGNIIFFGDSITAGLGVTPQQAYPALIQDKIDSLGWNFKVINAGVSGATSSDGVQRIDWILQQPVSVFVLELGGNDGLRGINLDLTKKNLQEIIDRVKKKYPHAKIIIAGMQVPPNLGQNYTQQFKLMFPELARKNNVALIPFLLKNVGGISSLNQQDEIHPNAKGHKIVADNVWQVLKPILEKIRDEGHTPSNAK